MSAPSAARSAPLPSGVAPRARRVLGYARVSSELQSHGSSLNDQQAAITAYAKAQGHKAPRFYVEAESAVHEKIERRDQVRALMAEVREGDLVICDKIDRWSRDPAFTYTSIREILARGASFYAVGDQCDPSTNEGDTMLNFRVLFAREEHKRIKQRMVGTRNLLVDRGYYAAGHPPMGYRRSLPKGSKGVEKNVLRLEEAEAETVRKVFAMCLGGRSITEIGEALELKRDRINDTLHNRVYLGEMRNSAGEWIKGRHPAIIDADVFARAHAALGGRRRGPRPGEGVAETRDWILRDVARCALCGGRMSAAYNAKGPKRQYYYRCFARCTNRYVNVRAIEAEAEPLIVARLSELRAELAREPMAPATKPPPDFAERRERLQRKRARYLEAFADEHMTREELRLALAKVDEGLMALDGEGRAAQRVSPLADAKVRRAALGRVGAISRAWSAATPEERRAIVSDLAHAARLAVDFPCTFVWRSGEEMATAIG